MKRLDFFLPAAWPSPQPAGGANARMVRAWLDWQLKGCHEKEKIFLNSDLTNYDGFTIQHKNFH
ncbi:MAG: hypothetical protein J6W75_06445 [Bacteroidaceae bacterium]|nr:hypothetical protein [Bacteroidaceae bacterium]